MFVTYNYTKTGKDVTPSAVFPALDTSFYSECWSYSLSVYSLSGRLYYAFF